MPSAADRPSWLHLAALFGLSAATLAFEILLLRLFEFSHWHYFAGFAIALALLGLGAAGTTLALLGAGPQRWGDGWFLGGLLTAALCLAGSGTACCAVTPELSQGALGFVDF